MDVSYFYDHSNRLSFGGDLGFRGFVSQFNWDQVYVRPAVKYFFSQSFDMTGGIAFFETWNKNAANVSEIRFFEQATITWPSFAILDVSHRFQAEQRFSSYSNSKFTLDDGFATRLRYRLNFETKDFKVFEKRIYFRLSGEIMQLRVSADTPFVNTNRISLGMGFRANNSSRYVINYSIHRSRVLIEETLEVSAHVIRLQVMFKSIK